MPYSRADILRMSDDDLRRLSSYDLSVMRGVDDKEVQDRVAPFEHADFVRDLTSRNLPLGLIAGTVGNLGYHGGKALRQAGVPEQYLPDKYFGGRSRSNLAGFLETLRGLDRGIGDITSSNVTGPLDRAGAALARALRGGD